MRAMLCGRPQRRESCDLLNQGAGYSVTTERESASILCMPIDALPDDLDALRALVNQLSSERDAAIAESRRLTEQNDQLRHLLKQLQRAQFGQRSERLDRDQMQLALEDIETSLADTRRGRGRAARTAQPTSRRINARSGASTAARCRRIFPMFMSRLSPRARSAHAATARCMSSGKRARSVSTRFRPSTR